MSDTERNELFALWQEHGTSWMSDSADGWALVDAIRAAGYRKESDTQWGIMNDDPVYWRTRIFLYDSEEKARVSASKNPGAWVVKRLISDWAPADPANQCAATFNGGRCDKIAGHADHHDSKEVNAAWQEGFGDDK